MISNGDRDRDRDRQPEAGRAEARQRQDDQISVAYAVDDNAQGEDRQPVFTIVSFI